MRKGKCSYAQCKLPSFRSGHASHFRTPCRHVRKYSGLHRGIHVSLLRGPAGMWQ